MILSKIDFKIKPKNWLLNCEKFKVLNLNVYFLLILTNVYWIFLKFDYFCTRKK